MTNANARSQSIYVTSTLADERAATPDPCELCNDGPIAVARICAPCALAALGRTTPRPDITPADSREHVVYYLRFGDRVKIGTTSHLASRLTNVPHDEILAIEPGGHSVERQRHRQFAHIKIATSGQEWFHLTPELAAHISTIS